MDTASVAVRKVGSEPVGAVRGVLDCFEEAERRLREYRSVDGSLGVGP